MPARIETVASFAKGLDVIRSFGVDARRQTITEVAARTGMTRAGARRFLHTLVEEGYARSDGKHFELTARVLELGNAYISGMTELETVRDILQDLTRELGESASAATLDGPDIIYVARSPARHRLMTIGLAVGTRLPAHATSMGQAILAQLSQNEFDRFMKESKLEKLTERTLTSREALRARLAEIREQGYAVVSEELEVGVRSIAVAIPGRPANARLAINISAQAGRIGSQEMVATFLPHLKRAAAQIAMGAAR
ncbi:IclR family transcriptional regulator domain-containing protein [Pinisolibacter sp.]|uniref:IclR family transcriptional regulator domain-containing protein n=1 Tax=Pinisolibacter sp. TaxID=2172024 RepID=UPI002FDF0032